MFVYALYYKKADGSYDGKAVGLFETEFQARQYVYQDGICPHLEIEIVKHQVQGDEDIQR